MSINHVYKNYRFESTELDNGDSMISISKDGQLVKQFMWPTYKIWNIVAHAPDIVEDLESGLMLAGSDGLGGNCYSGK